MRRADRLFQIIQLLRRRRTATTATHIAERLGVSERTVYRDIRDLVLAGTPIDGEAGVGYRVRPGYDLPPLMFDRDEIQRSEEHTSELQSLAYLVCRLLLEKKKKDKEKFEKRTYEKLDESVRT